MVAIAQVLAEGQARKLMLMRSQVTFAETIVKQD
jgi:hypothetical protein